MCYVCICSSNYIFIQLHKKNANCLLTKCWIKGKYAVWCMDQQRTLFLFCWKRKLGLISLITTLISCSERFVLVWFNQCASFSQKEGSLLCCDAYMVDPNCTGMSHNRNFYSEYLYLHQYGLMIDLVILMFY